MKRLVVETLEGKRILAEATLGPDERLDVSLKDPIMGREVETLLRSLFETATHYRTGGPTSDAQDSKRQTILKRAAGEERLYAVWDAIIREKPAIRGERIRVYVE